MKKTYLIFIVIWLLIVTGCTTKVSDTEPPQAKVLVNNKKILLKRGGYHWTTEVGNFFNSNQTTIADAASPNQIAQKFIASSVKKGSEATIEFSNHSKPKLTYQFWEDDQSGKPIIVEDNKIQLPTTLGQHIIEVHATWSNGDASYTFLIEVK